MGREPCQILERMKAAAAIAWASEISTYDTSGLSVRLICPPKKDAQKKRISYLLGERISYQLKIINRGKQPIQFRDVGLGGTRLRTFLRLGRGQNHRVDTGLYANAQMKPTLISLLPKQTITRDFIIDLPREAGRWTFFCTLSNTAEREPKVWARAIKTSSLTLPIGSPKKVAPAKGQPKKK